MCAGMSECVFIKSCVCVCVCVCGCARVCVCVEALLNYYFSINMRPPLFAPPLALQEVT